MSTNNSASSSPWCVSSPGTGLWASFSSSLHWVEMSILLTFAGILFVAILLEPWLEPLFS
jgi:hypothetical protein